MAGKDNIARGSGNVLADLGFAHPEEEMAKLRLTHAINAELERRKLTHASAVGHLGMSISEVGSLTNYKIAEFSVGHLMAWLTALGETSRSQSRRSRGRDPEARSAWKRVDARGPVDDRIKHSLSALQSIDPECAAAPMGHAIRVTDSSLCDWYLRRPRRNRGGASSSCAWVAGHSGRIQRPIPVRRTCTSRTKDFGAALRPFCRRRLWGGIAGTAPVQTLEVGQSCAVGSVLHLAAECLACRFVLLSSVASFPSTCGKRANESLDIMMVRRGAKTSETTRVWIGLRVLRRPVSRQRQRQETLGNAVTQWVWYALRSARRPTFSVYLSIGSSFLGPSAPAFARFASYG